MRPRIMYWLLPERRVEAYQNLSPGAWHQLTLRGSDDLELH